MNLSRKIDEVSLSFKRFRCLEANQESLPSMTFYLLVLQILHGLSLEIFNEIKKWKYSVINVKAVLVRYGLVHSKNFNFIRRFGTMHR